MTTPPDDNSQSNPEAAIASRLSEMATQMETIQKCLEKLVVAAFSTKGNNGNPGAKYAYMDEDEGTVP